MTKPPEIGDTIIIRGTICAFAGSHGFRFCQDEGVSSPTLNLSRISEIISKPWEPKVGDLITLDHPGYSYRVLHIDGNDMMCRVVKSPNRVFEGNTRIIFKNRGGVKLCAD